MAHIRNRIQGFITDKERRLLYLANKGLLPHMTDEEYLKHKWKSMMRTELDLENPISFNEKLQWLKLHDRNPAYTRMVDKCAVKEYVADKIGEQYIIPTLGIWDDPDKIDFDALPDQFVLKCNHNSGLGMCVCQDKSILDILKVKRGLRKGLKQKYYLYGREWPYKNVPPRILAEQYLANTSGLELPDYKFMCFHGKVRCIFTCTDRFSAAGLKVTIFDTDWKKMPFGRKRPNSSQPIPKPVHFEQMLVLAEILSDGIPFVRVDFYEVDQKIYFGELTFYPGSGFEEFSPPEWDNKLGEWIHV